MLPCRWLRTSTLREATSRPWWGWRLTPHWRRAHLHLISRWTCSSAVRSLRWWANFLLLLDLVGIKTSRSRKRLFSHASATSLPSNVLSYKWSLRLPIWVRKVRHSCGEVAHISHRYWWTGKAAAATTSSHRRCWSPVRLWPCHLRLLKGWRVTLDNFGVLFMRWSNNIAVCIAKVISRSFAKLLGRLARRVDWWTTSSSTLALVYLRGRVCRRTPELLHAWVVLWSTLFLLRSALRNFELFAAVREDRPRKKLGQPPRVRVENSVFEDEGCFSLVGSQDVQVL